MYQIGDRVSYPMHGAGVIEAIEKKEILGEIKQYYVLRFAVGGMKVMVPINQLQEVGLREIISPQECDRVMEHLCKSQPDVESNWNRRYRMNLDHIRSGNIYEVADVVRSLSLRDFERGLSTGERKMLGIARHIMVSELALASQTDTEVMEQQVDECLQRACDRATQEQAEAEAEAEAKAKTE